MNTVITRIMEIEKQSAIDIAQAEDACRKNIEAHRRALDEEKERVKTDIIKSENDRLTQAVQALNKQIEEESWLPSRSWNTCSRILSRLRL